MVAAMAGFPKAPVTFCWIRLWRGDISGSMECRNRLVFEAGAEVSQLDAGLFLHEVLIDKEMVVQTLSSK